MLKRVWAASTAVSSYNFNALEKNVKKTRFMRDIAKDGTDQVSIYSLLSMILAL